MRLLPRICLFALTALAAASPACAREGDHAIGIWRNTGNSVHIAAYRCGAAMCGKVVWANAKALSDAKRGGTANLIGTDLFRDFTRDRSGAYWRGQLFVPDISKTFRGKVEMVDSDTLKGSGCLIGGLFCKSQMLTRVR